MTVNRERKMIWAEVDTFDPEYLTLAELADSVQKMILAYGADAKIDRRERPYEDSDYLAVIKQRDETDEEMARRIQQEEYYAKMAEERERKEFERLKQKFGG